MKMMINSMKKNKEYYIVFIITILFKLLSLFQHADYYINQDRIGDLIAPATLAGRDWSRIIPKVKYYGYGFKWVYSVFFALTDNPYKIYYAIMLLYCVLMAGIAVLVYYITTKYLMKKNNTIAMILSIFMGLVGPVDMKSESSVYMASWIAVFLIIKAIYAEERKSKNKLAILIAFFLAYSLTLHERMLAMILGYAIVFILYRLKFKQWIFSPIVYFPVQVIIYYVVKQINDMYRKHFWGTTSVGNSTAIPSNLTRRLYFIESMSGFKLAIKCFWSNIVTLFTQTYGLALVAIVVFVVTILLMRTQKNGDGREYDIRERAQATIVWFGGICVAIVIAGLIVSWGSIIPAGNKYGYKGFVYGRYYVNFAYPAILGALCWIENHKVKIKYIVLGWLFGVGFISGFVKFIYPMLEEAYISYAATESTSDTSLYWILFHKFDGAGTIYQNFVINVFIIMIVWGLITIALLKKRTCRNGMILVTILAVIAMTSGFTISRPSVVFSGDIYGATYNFVSTIKASGKALKSNVIYTDTNAWTLQYLLNQYNVEYDLPPCTETEVIFISNNPPDEVASKLTDYESYKYTVIGDNQYLYYKGDYNRNIIESMGIQEQDLTFENISRDLSANEKSAIITQNERTMVLHGVDRPYNIVIVNDLHLIQPDDSVEKEYTDLVVQRYDSMRNQRGQAAADFWNEMSNDINMLESDLVIFAGDMVDYASYANYQCLEQGIKNIKSPIMYLRSDHDYSRHYTKGMPLDDVLRIQDELGNNDDIQIHDFGAFQILGVNNSWKSLSDESMSKIKKAISEEKQTVLVTHVPYDTPIDSDFRNQSMERRGMYNMWGIGDRYTPDNNVTDLMEMLYQKDSPFCAVVAGHLHYQYDTKLSENLSEIVFAPAYEGNIGIIHVVPSQY